MRARRLRSASRIDALVAEWESQYELTKAESAVFALAAHGTARPDLARERGVTDHTINSQVERVLEKTGHSSLDTAVNCLLRMIVEDG